MAEGRVPAGNTDAEHIGDGCYISHDGYQLWVSAERYGQMHYVAIGEIRTTAIADYQARLMKKYDLG